MSSQTDNTSNGPPAGLARHIWIAGVLGNMHDAAVAVVRCREENAPATFFASRWLSQAGLRALGTIQQSARILPDEIKRELGGVDWEAWEALIGCLPPKDTEQQSIVWDAMQDLTPNLLMALRRLRQRSPALFNAYGLMAPH